MPCEVFLLGGFAIDSCNSPAMALSALKLIVLLAAVVRAPKKGDHISSAALAQQSDGDYCNPGECCFEWCNPWTCTMAKCVDCPGGCDSPRGDVRPAKKIRAGACKGLRCKNLAGGPRPPRKASKYSESES